MEKFEELLDKPSLFLNESKFDVNFIPQKIPYREKELSLLYQLFLPLLINPNSISRKILIAGKKASGKTTTIKLFGELLNITATKRSVKIKCIYINCGEERTSYKILLKIIQTLDVNFRKKGYSTQGLLDFLVNIVHTKNMHIVIILDDLSRLLKKGDDLIYSYATFNAASFNDKHHISIIGITEDVPTLNNLDPAAFKILIRNVIRFTPFTKDQIYDILKHRISIGLKKNVISNDLLKKISELTHINGDIRYGLNILMKAIKIAESRNLKYVNLECVHLASEINKPFSSTEILGYTDLKKLILLYTIIDAIKKNKNSYISIADAILLYSNVYEKLGNHPRSYSQIWSHLEEFKRENLVNIETKSDSIGWRNTVLSVPDFNIKKLEAAIVRILGKKRIHVIEKLIDKRE
jgi:cell division control protein 6